MGVNDDGIAGDRQFPSTCWSLILHAADPRSPVFHENLRRLVELYWKPVYWVIRHSWKKSHDEAKDLTQEFFTTCVFDRALVSDFEAARGSFRTFLRVAVSSFLRNASRDGSRLKRGGAMEIVSLSDAPGDTVELPEDADTLTPEELFDHAWQQFLFRQIVTKLEETLRDEGKESAYVAFAHFHLTQGDPPSYAEIGDKLSFTVPQVKHALKHARAVLRAIAAEFVRQYVADPQELAAEMRPLLGDSSSP
jgi:RNA polymerase sigma factor (sigma-70 family)